MHAARQRQHALVHPVGFGVARQEVLPDAAAQEGLVALVAAVILLLLDQVARRHAARAAGSVHSFISMYEVVGR